MAVVQQVDRPGWSDAVAMAVGALLTASAFTVALYISMRRWHRRASFSSGMHMTLLRASAPLEAALSVSYELGKDGQPILLGQGSFGKV